MAFFISYLLSALGQYIRPTADRLEVGFLPWADKGSDMKNDILCSFYHILQQKTYKEDFF